MKLMNLVLLAMALLALPAHAQSTRGGKSEFYMGLGGTSGENYTFEGGSNAKTDTGYNLTLGYAFNFDQHKALGVEFGWGSQDYRANIVGDKLTIAYTQALALELIPQETPKKPAAKKKS